MADTVSDCGVDGVFRNVAFDSAVIVSSRIVTQRSALGFHFYGRFAKCAGSLRQFGPSLASRSPSSRSLPDRADIFRRDGFASNSRFGKSNVLGDRRIEVMTNHKHVEVLIQCVHRVGPGRISRGGQNIWLSTYFDDVRSVPATGPFGMISVDRAIFKCCDGIFDETGFVQGIGMERRPGCPFLRPR